MNKYTKNSLAVSKTDRHEALLDIVRAQPVRTQADLAARLKGRGIPCTQVSVSRDIRELGLVKRDGRYVAPEERIADEPDLEGLANTISVFLKEVTMVGENLIVVKTMPGTAHSVGLFLDQVDWPGLVGTVAGDDTLFLAVRGQKSGGEQVAGNLAEMMKG